MNILSLFDGMSGGQVALNRAGIKYEKYFASEIDRYAIKVAMKNYPKTIQIGDIQDEWAYIMRLQEEMDNILEENKIIENPRPPSQRQKNIFPKQKNRTRSSQALAAVRPKIDELGQLLIPSVQNQEIEKAVNSKGTINWFTKLDMKYVIPVIITPPYYFTYF